MIETNENPNPAGLPFLSKEDLAKTKPEIDKSHITPLKDRQVTEKLVRLFGGNPSEATANRESRPQEYLIKFNDKYPLSLYFEKGVILNNITIKENLPEKTIIDFTNMIGKTGQVHSKYIVTSPIDGKPEAGVIYIRTFNPEDKKYYDAHGFYPEIPAEDLLFSDKTKANLFEKGILERK